MKISSILILTALLFISTLSYAGELDGLTFCRSVASIFGPPGTRLHCVSFSNNMAKDNADTFFGNPPKSYKYRLIDNKVINASLNKETGYVLQGNTLVNGQQVLTLSI